MRTLTIPTTLIACVLLLALPAASAWADASDDRIILDCQTSPTGALRGSYTTRQLNHALHNLPGDVQEYTGCSDAIRQAMLAGAGRGGGNGTDTGGGGTTGGGNGTTGGGGATGAGGSPGGTDASAAQAHPPAGAERPVDVAGTAVAPGALPEIGKDSHRLPAALIAPIVLIALLALAALAPAALTIGRRVAGRRGA